MEKLKNAQSDPASGERTYLGTKTIKPLDLILTILASVSVGLEQKPDGITEGDRMSKEEVMGHDSYRFLK